MRNTTLIVLLFLVLISPFTNLHAQTPINSCNLEFMDNGSDSNYLNNTNDEWLICPDDSTQYLKLTFTHVNIETANNQGKDSTGCYDLLYIYDGIDASAPLIGSFCGEESGNGQSSFVDGHTLNVGDSFKPKNSEGCFFIRFESDQSKNLSGWIADVTCCTPSLKDGMTDGIDIPTPNNYGNIFNLEIDNSCTREGNLSMFTEFTPSGESCYTKGLTYPNQSFYAFTSNPSGGFVEFAIDSLDSVGIMEMVVFGPVMVDSLGNYVGGYINDCVTGKDPWSLFFNAGPNQTYILGVATEIDGRTNVVTLPSTVGLGGVLPVKMIDYKIKTRNEDVELTWTTSQEINNDKYDIYRSLDGINFNRIGSVKGKGNSQNENSYRFVDNPKTSGDIYYYVKQIDLDGTQNDYSILKVSFSTIKTEFTTYPNPSVGGNFSLDIDEYILEANPQLQIFDRMGQKLVDRKLNDSSSLNISNLTSGLYIVKITSGSTVITHQHMVY